MAASNKKAEDNHSEEEIVKAAETANEPDKKEEASKKEAAFDDAPQENKPTEVDPEYDRADPENKLEADNEDDNYVIDPVGGGKLERNSRFSPYRDL